VPPDRAAALLESPPLGAVRVAEPHPLVERAASAALTIGAQATLLGEVLGVDLEREPLSVLADVADALTRLGAGSSAWPSWGDPVQAHEAKEVLSTLHVKLADCLAIHRNLYESYTAAVLGVGVSAPPKRAQLVRRAAMGRTLAAVSHSGRRPRDLDAAIELVHAAAEARASVVLLSPLLDRHLGWLANGPMTDPDAAQLALDAVIDLHTALGDRLDTGRLTDLLAAEAFGCTEVSVPAAAATRAIDAWVRDSLAYSDLDLTMTAQGLAAWALTSRGI
jgi:hypothetical protein